MANENLNFKFTADINQFQSALASVQSGLKSVGSQMKDIGGQLTTYVSLPLAAVGLAAIKAFGDIQALKSGLKAVTGSAAEAEKQFARLQVVARLPGLGVEEAVKGAINLQVIGFTAARAETAMKALGNAVATVGGGKEQFQGALYGLQQLANTSTPLAEDLNILKERIPQITPLLKNAFGTARSDELAKMGVSSQVLVDTIIDGLAKLPAVTGGINAAFENLGDGVKSNLAGVGEIINNAFDVSSIVDGLVTNLTSLVNYFKELSPEIQKTIVLFGGLGVVIPPLLVAIGVFVGTILPALVAGFAALLSPIGLVVVALAGAAVLIVENWDSVVKYFTSGDGSGVWDSIKDGAVQLFTALSDTFTSIKSIVLSVWNLLGDSIMGITTTAFGEVLSIISNVFTGIAAAFKIVASVLTGNWAGLGSGLASLTHVIWNSIVDIIKNALKVTANLLGGFFKLIGMTQLGDALNATAKGYDTLFDKIKFGADKATTAIQNLKKATTAPADETVTTKTTTKTTPKTLTKGEQKVADVFSDLNVGLAQIDNSFKTTFDEKAEKRIEEYQKAIDALIKNGVSPLSDAVKQLKADQQRAFQLPTIGKSDSVASATANQYDSKGRAYVKDGKSVENKIDQTRNKDPYKDVTLAQQQLIRSTQVFNKDFSEIINQGMVDAFSGIGEAIGSALANGTSVISAVGASLLSTVGGVMVQLGQLAIKIGLGIKAIKLSLKSLNPVVAVAAGVALVALGSLFKGQASNIAGGGSEGNSPKKFANGGIVYGPTNAIVGEYQNAKTNPEIIAPLNKLKQLLPYNEVNGGNVSFEIKGDKLFGVLQNYNKQQYRTR